MLQRCTVIFVMNLVSELDLPASDYSAAGQIAGLFGVTGGPLGGVEGIYGIDKLPAIWST
jgi:hypothetical protein